MSKKQDKNIDPLLMDHDYDGIQELDNNLPGWWVGLFVITIIFSIYYTADHLYFNNKVDAEIYREYEISKNKQDKEESKKPTKEMTVLTDATSLANGKIIYDKNCTACHKPDAGGLVGPNLTDKFWIHGGSVTKIAHTISEGVPAKGMISWKAILKPKQILEVSSFILSLQGTNPAGAKAPEGKEE
ncbi:MAG: hypothetical protein COB02_01745 [Candidatus Cloacimonadota bacterium]|nr:MAG: hypothetical protein COB02_01745 [Candidatus Cloacimonadota bacterium]